MEKKLSFETLPDQVRELQAKLTHIEEMLLQLASQQTNYEQYEKPMTVRDLAIFLSESESSIYRKTSNKEVPHMQRGAKGPIYFFRCEINNWLKEARIKTKKELQEEAKLFIGEHRKKAS